MIKNLRSPRLLALIPLLAAPALPEIAAEDSPWDADFNANDGLRLSYEGVPVIRKSTLYVVQPRWTGFHYNQEQIAHRIERDETPKGFVLTATGENDAFLADYRFEAIDDTRFRVIFEGTLKKDIPAHMEYSSGYFNANLVAGRPFRAETRDGRVEGTVATFPDTTDQIANDLAPYFQTLDFDSRLGDLRIQAESGDERILFFDARRDPQGWARDAPVFWAGLGVPERPLAYGEPVRFEMVIEIEPADKPADHPSKSIEAKTSPVAAAQSARDRPVQLIPAPKSAAWNENSEFILEEGVEFAVFQSFDDFEFDERVPDALEGLLDKHNLDPEGEIFPMRSGAEIQIYPAGQPIEETPDLPHEADWFENPEGYRLIVDDDGIVIQASEQQGAFYGIQTLAQLLRPSDHGVRAPAVEIEDWPTLAFRGAHWFPSQAGVPFHRRLTERVLAAFKYNHSIIQCEAAKWESAPEIAAPDSIELDKLQELVDLNRQNFVRPIPLINVPGHAEWIFRNDQNLDIVEDPDVPYAYCVNHPRSIEFITDILAEANSIFQPDRIHLGHDEITMRGQFPHPDCPRCEGETVTSLMLHHLETLDMFLSERRLDIMIWGDMMLARDEIPDTAAFAENVEEARARRAGIPDGITITDWHYYQGKEYPSLELFQEAGHDVIASTWHRPENIHHFSRAAIEADALGLLQTTWAGFFPDESVLDDALHQFTAFVLAAEYAWSGRDVPPNALEFDPGAVFLDAYYGAGAEERDGMLVDLSAAAAVPRENALELHDNWDLATLPGGRERFADILFEIPAEKLPVIGGRFAPKESVGALSITSSGLKAGKIALLNAALFGAPDGTVAARLTVEYADGATVTEDLTIGKNTAFWGSDSPVRHATAGWKSLSPEETPMTLRVTHWENPHPEKEITAIEFNAGDPEQAWVLAGLTVLN